MRLSKEERQLARAARRAQKKSIDYALLAESIDYKKLAKLVKENG